MKMGINTFEVKLMDGKNGMYTAGQWIKGKVLVNFKQQTKVKCKLKK